MNFNFVTRDIVPLHLSHFVAANDITFDDDIFSCIEVDATADVDGIHPVSYFVR
jgi:hypothetical protein